MFRSSLPTPAVDLRVVFQQIINYQKGMGFTFVEAPILHDFFNNPAHHKQRQELRLGLFQKFGEGVDDHLKMVATDVLESLWKPNNFAFFDELDEGARLRKENKNLQEKMSLQHQVINELSQQLASSQERLAQQHDQIKSLSEQVATQELSKQLAGMRQKHSEETVNTLNTEIQKLHIEIEQHAQKEKAPEGDKKLYSRKQFMMYTQDVRDLNDRMVTKTLQLRAAIADFKQQIKTLKEANQAGSILENEKTVKIKKLEEHIKSSEKGMKRLQDKFAALQKQIQETPAKEQTPSLPVTVPNESLSPLAPVQHLSEWSQLASKVDVKDDPYGEKVRGILIEMIASISHNMTNHLLLCANMSFPATHPLYLGLSSFLSPGLLTELPHDTKKAETYLISAFLREILLQKSNGFFIPVANTPENDYHQFRDYLTGILNHYLMHFHADPLVKNNVVKLEQIVRFVKSSDTPPKSPVQPQPQLKIEVTVEAEVEKPTPREAQTSGVLDKISPTPRQRGLSRLQKAGEELKKNLQLHPKRKPQLIEETLEKIFTNMRTDFGPFSAHHYLDFLVVGMCKEQFDSTLAHELFMGICPVLFNTVLPSLASHEAIEKIINLAMKYLKTWKGNCLSDREYNSGQYKLDFLLLVIQLYCEFFDGTILSEIQTLSMITVHMRKNEERLVQEYEELIPVYKNNKTGKLIINKVSLKKPNKKAFFNIGFFQTNAVDPISQATGAKIMQTWTDLAETLSETSDPSSDHVKDTLKQILALLIENIDKTTPELAVQNHLLICQKFELPHTHSLYTGLTHLIHPVFLANIAKRNGTQDDAHAQYMSDLVKQGVLIQKTRNIFPINPESQNSTEQQICVLLMQIIKEYIHQFGHLPALKDSLETIHEINSNLNDFFERGIDSHDPVKSENMLLSSQQSSSESALIPLSNHSSSNKMAKK